MNYRTVLALIATFAMLALAGCKDKDGDSGSASNAAPASVVLPA